MKRAFITGIGGQDGSYLAELLLDQGYEVHGLVRGRSGDAPPARLRHLFQGNLPHAARLHFYAGDLDDEAGLSEALKAVPEELYHLAAQSHPGQSFDTAEETCRVTGLGTVRLLNIVRGLPRPPRFFHASSSEIFGRQARPPQDESTPINPVTPYGCAKALGTQMVRIYRQALGLFAVNGILFNHESPRRGADFVTRKICRAAAAISLGRQSELVLGDMTAQRDWGHARDYVRGMWLALQHQTPEDLVFATGRLHSVQDLVEMAFAAVGLDWRAHVRQDPRLFRIAEPCQLVGNAAKARRLLSWEPQLTLAQTILEMVQAELATLQTSP